MPIVALLKLYYKDYNLRKYVDMNKSKNEN